MVLKDPESNEPTYFVATALPFGASESVHGFNRLAAALNFLAHKECGLPICKYFDDYTLILSAAVALEGDKLFRRHIREALAPALLAAVFRIINHAAHRLSAHIHQLYDAHLYNLAARAQPLAFLTCGQPFAHLGRRSMMESLATPRELVDLRLVQPPSGALLHCETKLCPCMQAGPPHPLISLLASECVSPKDHQ